MISYPAFDEHRTMAVPDSLDETAEDDVYVDEPYE